MQQPELKKTAFGVECNIPWEEMQELRPGCKFCAHCSREIIDYRALSRKEVKALLANNENICGVFDVGQLSYEVKLPSLKYIAGLLIPIWLLSDPAAVVGKEVKIEMSKGAIRDSTITKISLGAEQYYIPEENSDANEIQGSKLYFTRRFPFIHFRKRTTIGMIKNPYRE